jgi:DNA polymerase III subunit epsilon
VDVETSGLSAKADRVLSVAAFALDELGRPEREFSSLLNPGCDPGPVHIHGLTKARLAGAPVFADIQPQLWEILDGRVLVAHNASFDHGFLQAEASRSGQLLPTQDRLCTLALSRRLGLDVPDFRLDTVASYWRVPRGRSHDARDDARALVDVFAYSVDLAHRLGMSLPVVRTAAGPVVAPYPSSWVKKPSPWHNPGRLVLGAPLVQGMKVVITGNTRQPREAIYASLEGAGLDVMESVSRLTSVLVCNDAGVVSRKIDRASREQTLIVDERTLQQLLCDVQAGVPKSVRARAASVAPSAVVDALPAPRRPSDPAGDVPDVSRRIPGPYARRRVLVIGGSHDEAVAMREAVVARGGSAAVNLSANVTDVVVLAGGEGDPRLARAAGAGVTIRRSLDEGVETAVEQTPAIALVMPRGGAIDLPDSGVWTVNASWSLEVVDADADLVALIVDEAGQVVTDEDFVFYNAPASEDEAVTLSVDGTSEQSIRVDLSRLPEHARRVVIAASLAGSCTFGDLGAIALAVDGTSSTYVTATLDAGTSEQTMILAEIYLRGDRWRLRVVGQGYDHGLATLISGYGVDVD